MANIKSRYNDMKYENGIPSKIWSKKKYYEVLDEAIDYDARPYNVTDLTGYVSGYYRPEYIERQLRYTRAHYYKGMPSSDLITQRRVSDEIFYQQQRLAQPVPVGHITHLNVPADVYNAWANITPRDYNDDFNHRRNLINLYLTCYESDKVERVKFIMSDYSSPDNYLAFLDIDPDRMSESQHLIYLDIIKFYSDDYTKQRTNDLRLAAQIIQNQNDAAQQKLRQILDDKNNVTPLQEYHDITPEDLLTNQYGIRYIDKNGLLHQYRDATDNIPDDDNEIIDQSENMRIARIENSSNILNEQNTLDSQSVVNMNNENNKNLIDNEFDLVANNAFLNAQDESPVVVTNYTNNPIYSQPTNSNQNVQKYVQPVQKVQPTPRAQPIQQVQPTQPIQQIQQVQPTQQVKPAQQYQPIQQVQQQPIQQTFISKPQDVNIQPMRFSKEKVVIDNSFINNYNTLPNTQLKNTFDVPQCYTITDLIMARKQIEAQNKELISVITLNQINSNLDIVTQANDFQQQTADQQNQTYPPNYR